MRFSAVTCNENVCSNTRCVYHWNLYNEMMLLYIIQQSIMCLRVLIASIRSKMFGFEHRNHRLFPAKLTRISPHQNFACKKSPVRIDNQTKCKHSNGYVVYVIPKNVAQSDANAHTHKTGCFIQILQLNYVVYVHKRTQLSTGIRSHFTVDYKDWRCDTDAHHHCHFPFCVPFFLLGILA